MIDEFVRGIANGTWLFLNLGLAFVFWRHFIIRAREDGIKQAYREITAKAALSLAVYFTGSAIMRAWVWFLLILQRAGDEIAFLTDRPEIALFAATVAVIGALCCIRVFSPGRYGRYFWIGTGVAAVIVPGAVHWLVG